MLNHLREVEIRQLDRIDVRRARLAFVAPTEIDRVIRPIIERRQVLILICQLLKEPLRLVSAMLKDGAQLFDLVVGDRARFELPRALEQIFDVVSTSRRRSCVAIVDAVRSEIHVAP